MFTLFAMPKPFRDRIGVIQMNALKSWSLLPGIDEVLLFGDEEGTRELAEEFGYTHVPSVRRNEMGTPLLDDIFAQAKALSTYPVVCYVNADIILMSDVVEAFRLVNERFESFLLVTQRWNLELAELLEFEPGWEETLRNDVRLRGELFTPYGIDLFMFTKDCYDRIPSFALGRSYWDNWLISSMRQAGRPVIDATPMLTIVHQNHGYSGFASINEISSSFEGRRNFYYIGDSFFSLGRTVDATHVATGEAIVPAKTLSVSVVIPHYGSLRSLYRCLRGLMYQSYPRTFVDIIVVNNDPEAALGHIALDFPHVRVVHEFKVGPAAARNKGIACSTGDVIALLDSDTVPEPTWLEMGVKTLEQLGGDGFVACNIVPSFQRANSRNTVELYDSITYYEQEDYVRYRNAFITAGVIFPRRLFQLVGAFDERFQEPAFEDWDWSLRVSAAGIPIRFSPSSKVKHPTRRRFKDLREKVRRLARGGIILKEKLGSEPAPRGAVLVKEFVSAVQRLAKKCRKDKRLRGFERWRVFLLGIHVECWSLREKLRYARRPPAEMEEG